MGKYSVSKTVRNAQRSSLDEVQGGGARVGSGQDTKPVVAGAVHGVRLPVVQDEPADGVNRSGDGDLDLFAANGFGSIRFNPTIGWATFRTTNRPAGVSLGASAEPVLYHFSHAR